MHRRRGRAGTGDALLGGGGLDFEGDGVVVGVAEPQDLRDFAREGP